MFQVRAQSFNEPPKFILAPVKSGGRLAFRCGGTRREVGVGQRLVEGPRGQWKRRAKPQPAPVLATRSACKLKVRVGRRTKHNCPLRLKGRHGVISATCLIRPAFWGSGRRAQAQQRRGDGRAGGGGRRKEGPPKLQCCRDTKFFGGRCILQGKGAPFAPPKGVPHAFRPWLPQRAGMAA
jgi:hypothetical protein